jgi:hypothetical protein
MGLARLVVFGASLVAAMAARLEAQTTDTTNVTDEYRATVFPHYPFQGS